MVVATLLELAGGCLLNGIEGFVSSGPSRYIAKYIAVPVVGNSLLALAAYCVIRSSSISQRTKRYMVSLAMTGVCTVIYTVHNIFPALLLLFAVNIMLTGTYGDYCLSTVVAVLCFLAPLVANFFIVWDYTQSYVLSDPIEIVNWILGELLLLGSYLTCLATICYERKRILSALAAERQRQWMQDQLLQDEMTKLLNRSALNQELTQMCERGSGLLVMMDLDHFKQLNDTRGHLQGDCCLRKVAEVLRREIGPQASFRYGGDEFCLVFDSGHPETAVDVCRRVQEQLYQIQDFLPLRVQASFGVARCCQGMDPLQLLRHADSALYSAKIRRSDIFVYQEKQAFGDE